MLNFMKVSNLRLSKKSAKVMALVLASSLCLSACGGNAATDSAETAASASEVSVETVGSEIEENVTEASVEIEEVTEEIVEEEKDPVINVITTERNFPDSEALEFVRNLGAGWNLGNTFDANDGSKSKDDLAYETLWQNNVTTKQNILDLKEAGFKTIRVPVSWHNHVDDNFVISQVWLDRVEEVVNWILEEDMYVILNIHHDNEKKYMYPSYETLDNSKKYVSTVWEQIARTFGDCDEHLIFECLNEPRMKDTDHEWWVDVKSEVGKECIDCVNQLNQVAVDTIRSTEGKYNTERYIMCPGYCASPDFAYADAYQLPDDSKATKENRLLVSIHAYTPYAFALAEPKEATDQFTIFHNDDTKDINLLLMRMYQKFIKEDGIGVVIGEFGSRKRGNNVEARAQHAAYFAATARSYGMSCVWWDNNNRSGSGEEFAIYNRKANKIEYPEIVAQLVYYGNN